MEGSRDQAEERYCQRVRCAGLGKRYDWLLQLLIGQKLARSLDPSRRLPVLAKWGETNSSGNAIQNVERAAWTWKEWSDIHPHEADCTSLANLDHRDLE